MAFTETLVKNQAYRVYTDTDPATGDDHYDKLSFYTSSDDVHFEGESGISLTQKTQEIVDNTLAYASATLVAGETTVVVTGDKITADGMLDIYVPIAYCKVTPESITNQIDGSVTLTFPPQEEDIEVRVICKN